MKTETLYIGDEYLEQNPNWHREDAPWKANLVAALLKDHQIQVDSICEVGCGAGTILRYLRVRFPPSSLFGYDISSQATWFWAGDQNAWLLTQPCLSLTGCSTLIVPNV